MLVSLVLCLQSPEPAILPVDLGRAAESLLLRLVGFQKPTLVAELHDGQGPKPFTASNLVLGRRRGSSRYIEAGDNGWVRFTGLAEEVSRSLLPVATSPPDAVELGNHRLTVTEATMDPALHPWAGQSACQQLAELYLLNQPRNLARDVELEFASPTAFRSKDMDMPFPLPGLVFGSLADRWNAVSSVPLDPGVRQFCEEYVAISEYDMRSRPVRLKGSGPRRGGEGRVRYGMLNTEDPYWLAALNILADFSFFSGVGIQTAKGMGQVRRV